MWTVREARGDADRVNVKDIQFGTKREAQDYIDRQRVSTIQRMGRMYVIRITTGGKA